MSKNVRFATNRGNRVQKQSAANAASKLPIGASEEAGLSAARVIQFLGRVRVTIRICIPNSRTFWETSARLSERELRGLGGTSRTLSLAACDHDHR
jgi:hypothetical protein